MFTININIHFFLFISVDDNILVGLRSDISI